MVLISGINGSGLYAAYSVSAEKDDAGNVITATYMKDALFDFTDSDEISGYNGSAFATPAELSAGINTKIENNIVDVKNISCSAEGSGNIALGTSSIAGGKNSFIYGLGGSGSATNIASGNHCIVMGCHSSAMGNYSTVFGGNYCLASGDFDPNDGKQYWGPFAQGVHTSSIGQYSHAEGGNTLANGTLSHAEGIKTLASGGYSHAEGSNTSAIGQTSHAEGGHVLASGTCSHAEGAYTSALGGNSNAQGEYTIASGGGSHSEGKDTSAFGNFAHTEGIKTIALTSNSHAEGQRTSAVGISTHAEGDLTVASANCSHAEGNGSYTLGNRSHAEGSGTSAYGICSHSEGIHTEASGNYSHTEGQGTIAGSDYMHVAGTYNETTADALYVIGNGTAADARSDAFIVYPDGSVSAQGKISANGVELGATTPELSAGTDLIIQNNIISVNTDGTANSADMAFVEGSATLASGKCSHAEGGGTSAIGTYAHAEGVDTKAAGEESHAEGHRTSALGYASHAEGDFTIAGTYNMHAGGMYNKTSAEAAFVIGNGTSNTSRSDAFIVDWSGCASAVTLATSGISDVESAINEISAGLVDADDFVKTSAINCTIGFENSALSGDTLAQGTHNSAVSSSFAQGTTNYADNYSIAQGNSNTASNYSQAFGKENSATNRSFIAGINNSANSGAFVLGSYNNASGAILLGSYLTGKSFEMEDTSYGESFAIDYNVYPVIVGRSNKTSSDAYFVVGNGDDPDAEIRSDAFIVSSNNIASAADFLAGNGVSLSSLTGINIDSFVKYNDIQYAIGSANTATGSTTSRYSVALGTRNSAYNSFVIGNYNKGKESHIFGDSNSGINSYIVGYNCTGTESYLFGKDLSGKSWGIELGDFGDTCYPVIVGNKNATNTSAYFVVGCGNTLGNEDAFIVSSNKVASAADFRTGNGVSLSSLTGLTPLSAGTDLKIENDIISVDTNGTAIGDYAFVAGSSTVASGTSTFAIGQNTSAIYSNSVAMGISSIANKAVAFAQGDRVSANGYASHAEGGFTYTENNYAHAEGYGTSAFSQTVLGNIAFQSHAEGTYCIASGRSCHAEGENTSAIGTMCHAEGKGTLATAYNHAEGVGTSALGVGSHSEGYYTIASSVAMHAGGKFNKTSANALFVLGNGSDDSARSDAFIVTSGGLASAADFLAGNGVSLSSLTGLSQVQADWDETVTSNPAYIQNKPDVLIPVDSPAALGGISKPTNIMVVSALPASPDSATIYLVQGTMIGN